MKNWISEAGWSNAVTIDKDEKPISNETEFKNWLLNTGTVNNAPDGLYNLIEPLDDINK